MFGWDYIYWQNISGNGIARIHVDAECNPYYYRYKSINLIDKLTKEHIAHYGIIFLTCDRKKYVGYGG
jgi:hypothetical protein